jgi:hypothetical protein
MAACSSANYNRRYWADRSIHFREFFIMLKRDLARIAGLTVLLAVNLAAACVPAAEISMSSLLDDMTNLTKLAEFPDPPFVAKQFSSYDRASTTPADPKTWFANNDCGNYLRVEERNGRKEYVMADIPGPGAITRIWSPNPGGTMRIYLNGNETPALEYPMADLLGGKHSLLPPPIAIELSTGWNLYFPIPYAKSCKVTCDKGGQYYHVAYRTYPKGTEVKTFTLEKLKEAVPAIRKLAGELRLPEKKDEHQVLKTACYEMSLPPGESGKLWQHPEPGSGDPAWEKPGPGAIYHFSVGLTTKGPVETALRKVIVQMSFDGEETVEAPLGDFFGAGPGVNPFATMPLRVDATGQMVCKFVMPFKETSKVRLINRSSDAIKFSGCVSASTWTWTSRSMYFHAKWKSEFDVPTRPMRDWNYLTAKGKGVFAGVAFSIDNPAKEWWGEGDEKIYVDGETFPSHFGTGTEDYYGYGWGNTKLFTHAYHSQSRCDGPGNYGRTSLNRFDILDRIPFTKDFKFDMELWHWKDCKVNMAVTAYYYALPGAEDTFPPIKPEQLVVRPMPAFVVPRVAGAIEGESMRILKSTGSPEPQDWDGDSGGRHLWWKGGQKPGDELRLEFNVPKAGRYRVFGRFLKAVDYGVIQLAINDHKAGGPIDFYHAGVVQTGEISLGTFELRKGANELSANVVGSNPKAQKQYMFGLDYLLLKPSE